MIVIGLVLPRQGRRYRRLIKGRYIGIIMNLQRHILVRYLCDGYGFRTTSRNSECHNHNTKDSNYRAETIYLHSVTSYHIDFYQYLSIS